MSRADLEEDRRKPNRLADRGSRLTARQQWLGHGREERAGQASGARGELAPRDRIGLRAEPGEARGHARGILVVDEEAAVRRTGDDLVIVTYSRQLHHALAAAEAMARKGVQATVIDLRSLNPLDFDTVRTHVERVGRVMVVSEGVMTAGVGAELSARIHEECFDFLAEPVIRVCGEDIPISVSVELEKNSVPTAAFIQSAGEKLVGLRTAA